MHIYIHIYKTPLAEAATRCEAADVRSLVCFFSIFFFTLQPRVDRITRLRALNTRPHPYPAHARWSPSELNPHTLKSWICLLGLPTRLWVCRRAHAHWSPWNLQPKILDLLILNSESYASSVRKSATTRERIENQGLSISGSPANGAGVDLLILNSVVADAPSLAGDPTILNSRSKTQSCTLRPAPLHPLPKP